MDIIKCRPLLICFSEIKNILIGNKKDIMRTNTDFILMFISKHGGKIRYPLIWNLFLMLAWTLASHVCNCYYVLLGAKWRSHRKMIAPTFHINILKSFMGVFNQNSKNVVEKMQSEIGKTFDVHDHMSGVTVDILLGMHFIFRSTI